MRAGLTLEQLWAKLQEKPAEDTKVRGNSGHYVGETWTEGRRVFTQATPTLVIETTPPSEEDIQKATEYLRLASEPYMEMSDEELTAIGREAKYKECGY